MISSFLKFVRGAFRPREFFTSFIATTTYFSFAFFYFKWVLNISQFYWPISIPLYLSLIYINYFVLCRAKDKVVQGIQKQTRKEIEKVLRKEMEPEMFSEEFTFDLQEKMARMANAAENPLPKSKLSGHMTIAEEYEKIHREYLERMRQAELNKSIYESGLNRLISADEKNKDAIANEK